MRARWLLSCVVAFALGCGSKSFKYAPVSGTVTMNDKPLVGATVTFSPIAPEGTAIAGNSSSGKTNDKGEFVLTSSSGTNGAVVGKHRVSITLVSAETGDHDTRPPRGGWPHKNDVPERYNPKSTEEFEVTSGRTDQANFKLRSP